jgi:hypothetical protein
VAGAAAGAVACGGAAAEAAAFSGAAEAAAAIKRPKTTVEEVRTSDPPIVFSMVPPFSVHDP